ncbi:MAG: hypothetical protein V4640_10835 [Verrucomicrobiota bacterium]
MPEFDATLLTLLSGTCLALLVGVTVALVRVSGRLSRIETLLQHPTARPESAESVSTDTESSNSGAFELFLSEDASRRELTKGEQFSAYRKWRQQKGMNWSNS